jgi:sterol desaturase/sphingolipid hydroxylase (fatty acid hydroxylase superfamily)
MPWIKIVATGVWFAGLASGERAAPAAMRPSGGEVLRLQRNLGLWASNSLMNPFVTLPISAVAAAATLWTRPAMPAWLGLALDFAVLDLWAYAWHRANHEWRLLWRFHRVHHLDRFLDTTSAVRFHPGEVLISALARTPLIVGAAIPFGSIASFDTALLMVTLFHHSNLRLPTSFEATLRLFLVTPSHHWVHHHVARSDTDSNYGALLTLWDRLFASWSPNQRTPAMAIGVGDEPDAPLLSLALAPFRATGER